MGLQATVDNINSSDIVIVHLFSYKVILDVNMLEIQDSWQLQWQTSCLHESLQLHSFLLNLH